MEKIVVKIGTESLLNCSGLLDVSKGKISTIINNIQSLVSAGIGVVLVSSGAVGLGKQEFKKPTGMEDIKYSQACAGIGQAIMIAEYKKAFNEFGLKNVSQLLVTHSDMQNPARLNTIKENLDIYLENGILPIVNENDVITKEELLNVGKQADNDRLSLQIAKLIGAKVLMIITNTDGIYTKDPSESGSQRIPYIIDGDFSKISFSSKSAQGTGGMESKVAVAKSAYASGIETHILDGIHSNIMEHYNGMQSGGTIIKVR